MNSQNFKRLHKTWGQVSNFLKNHTKLRWLAYLSGGLVATLLFMMVWFRPVSSNVSLIGTSFSVKYAEELGNDWQDNYTALLDDLGVKHLRLMSYWDRHEPQPDEFDFTELDWQFDEAHKRGADISLALGLRQPRWPECHQADWASEFEKQNYESYLARLVNYTSTVVERYKDHPALRSYQLENEALNHFFGGCNISDNDLIRRRITLQFDAIKQLDPNKDIVMSLSDQHGFPLQGPEPDVYGLSVYRVIYQFDRYLTYPTPTWYHRARAAAVRTIKDRPTIIHELQLEPWGPNATVDLPLEEQAKSMSTDRMRSNFSFAESIGIEEIYTWGSEWWYWRLTQHNDDSVWETARQLHQLPNLSQSQ